MTVKVVDESRLINLALNEAKMKDNGNPRQKVRKGMDQEEIVGKRDVAVLINNKSVV